MKLNFRLRKILCMLRKYLFVPLKKKNKEKLSNFNVGPLSIHKYGHIFLFNLLIWCILLIDFLILNL